MSAIALLVTAGFFRPQIDEAYEGAKFTVAHTYDKWSDRKNAPMYRKYRRILDYPKSRQWIASKMRDLPDDMHPDVADQVIIGLHHLWIGALVWEKSFDRVYATRAAKTIRETASRVFLDHVVKVDLHDANNASDISNVAEDLHKLMKPHQSANDIITNLTYYAYVRPERGARGAPA